MKDRDFLGKEPIGKLLLKLALPTVLAQLVNLAYNLVDRIYIGHIDGFGADALTGIGVCAPVIMIVSAFAALTGSCGGPIASMELGRGNRDRAELVLGNCFFMQIIVSAILTAVLLIWNEDFLLAFGASQKTIGYASGYMGVYAVGTVFVQLTLGMGAFISCQGFAKTSMLTVVIGALANIILDPIFIYGFDLGVKGAAIATIISQGLSCGFVMLFLTGKRTCLKLRLKNIRLQPKIFLPCIALGLSHFIMQASESVIGVCFNASLQSYGGDIAVGAMAILMSVMQFAMLPMQGLAQGSQPITSYNFGAKNQQRVKKSFTILLVSCLIYSTVVWAIIMIFPRGIASVFTSDAALIDYTVRPLRTYCAVLLIFGIQVACQMTFVSIGNAKSSIAVAVVRKFVLLLPLIYIVPGLCSDKAAGVYLAEPIADLIAVTFTAILFYFQFKKSLKKLTDEG